MKEVAKGRIFRLKEELRLLAQQVQLGQARVSDSTVRCFW